MEIERESAGDEESAAACDRARQELVGEAARVFNGELIELIDSIRRDKEQTIDHEGLDTLTGAGWAGDAHRERSGDGSRTSGNTWKTTVTRSKL